MGMAEMSMRIWMPVCRTAEKSNIPWREMTKEVLESDVYEVFERIRDPNLVYPDCELTSPAFLCFSSLIHFTITFDPKIDYMKSNKLE